MNSKTPIDFGWRRAKWAMRTPTTIAGIPRSNEIQPSLRRCDSSSRLSRAITVSPLLLP